MEINNINNNPVDPDSRIDLSAFSHKIAVLRSQIGAVVVGQERAVELILTAIIADGHVLVEGVPGIAKTLLTRLIAKLISADFRRIQFTPDLMPSDVLGNNVYNLKSQEFEFHRGPVFTNILLADEINRAPAKTQAALFEVMEERQCTVDGVTRPMPALYTVLATQNPIEQEGTYRLPEAQLDRFLMKITMGYPPLEQEVEILNRHNSGSSFAKLDNVRPVITADEMISLRRLMDSVHVDPSLIRYIALIIQQSRMSQALQLGASPRASIGILRAAKAFALLQGRDFVIPDDIATVIPPVLEHRIILTADAEMQGFTAAKITRSLIDKVEVPK